MWTDTDSRCGGCLFWLDIVHYGIRKVPKVTYLPLLLAGGVAGSRVARRFPF